MQGGQVFGFFLSSGLTKSALGDIWDEATQKQSGGLNLAKFINAMKLIALAQKGIPPKLPNIAMNAPVAMPQMNYPSHIKKPNINQQSQQPQQQQMQQQMQQPQQQQSKPAEPDPFGGLTSGLGFGDLGKSNDNNNNGVKGGGAPSGPTWDTDLTANAPNTNKGNDLLGGDNNNNNNYDANSALSHNSTFDSPNYNTNITNPNSSNDNLSMTPGGPLSGNPLSNGINEYGPASHMKQSSHVPTLMVDSGGIGGGIGGGYGPSSSLTGGGISSNNHNDDSVAPPGLNRRISTKILYQEERLREQIRQAEQREKLAKKQANTQRIENERLERENEQLKLEINSARQAQADALKQSQAALTSIQPLQVENEKLKQAINQWKELIQTKDEELEALEAEVDNLRLENEKLENTLTADKSKVDDIQFRYERADAELREIKSKSKDYEIQINQLKQEKIQLEDDKRNQDLQIAQIKDEMKKLKRNQNSGLGISDRNTLQKTEASLFDINNMSLNVSPSPSKPVSSISSPQQQQQPQSILNDNDKAESDDDDTGIVPPGSHDFNFGVATNNNIDDSINEYGPGAMTSSRTSPPRYNNNNNNNNDDEEEEEEESSSDDNEPDMIDKIVEERVEIEEDVISTVLIDEEYKSSPWYMSSTDKQAYHKYFLQADANQDGVIDGGEANKFFTKSKLNRKSLAKIWVLADQEKKGRLTESMFCSMFHLVMKIKKSGGELKVPSEMPKCLTVAVVEKLGTKIQKTTKQKKWITQKKTVKVVNPNKKNKKSKKSKKKKSSPPMTNGNKNGGGFGNDGWGNDFSFAAEPATNTTTTSDSIMNNSSQQTTKQQPQSTQNDDNWNAFGQFFDNQ